MTAATESTSSPDAKDASNIDERRLFIFKRLINTLPVLNIVSALTAGTSVGALTFDEFHPSSSPLCRASEALFASCAIAAVVSIMLSVMLIFWFETVESVVMRDYFLVWTPVILLDWSILALLFGITFWYADRNVVWRATLINLQTGTLLILSICVAVRMAITLRRKESLNRGVGAGG
ncbi:hypothetical protein Daus18300_008212 [Diaporthe australafricana]|uniref:MARVEL domain-containing protein n=1 Tax=Diaporthe australafricana TaxID=127596 RepID=A0ABR3WJS5_9PEZI